MEFIIIAVILYLITGVVAGFAAGLFGIGGGIIFIPILITTLPYFGGHEIDIIHVAIGTSLALIVPAGIAATIKQYRLQHLDFSFIPSWVIGIFIGAIIGAVIIHFIPSHILQILFCFFLIAVILSVIFRKHQSKDDDHELPPPRWMWRVPVSLFVGITSVFFGIGGGLVTVPFLSITGYPIKKAIAVSSCSSVVIGAVGAIALIIISRNVTLLPHYSFGYFNWLAFICLAPTTLLMAPVGVHVGNKLSEPVLKWVYVVFLVCVTGYMFYKTFSVSTHA